MMYGNFICMNTFVKHLSYAGTIQSALQDNKYSNGKAISSSKVQTGDPQVKNMERRARE